MRFLCRHILADMSVRSTPLALNPRAAEFYPSLAPSSSSSAPLSIPVTTPSNVDVAADIEILASDESVDLLDEDRPDIDPVRCHMAHCTRLTKRVMLTVFDHAPVVSICVSCAIVHHVSTVWRASRPACQTEGCDLKISFKNKLNQCSRCFQLSHRFKCVSEGCKEWLYNKGTIDSMCVLCHSRMKSNQIAFDLAPGPSQERPPGGL